LTGAGQIIATIALTSSSGEGRRAALLARPRSLDCGQIRQKTYASCDTKKRGFFKEPALLFLPFTMRPNNGVTCPGIATYNWAGKAFSPHPHVGWSAATAGSGFTQGWAVW